MPRAQSVRRTSLRDKTLTTKKDAVEEARLRLQAQEVFVSPDSTTLDPNGQQQESSADWLSKSSMANHNNHSHINNNNNTLKTNNNHRNSYDPSLKDMVDSNSISQQQQHSYQPRRPPEGRENDELQMHAFKTNGEHSTGGAVGLHSNGTNGVGGISDGTTATGAVIAATTAATTTTGHGTEAVQIQSSKEATNGKINVQVTVLVGKCQHTFRHNSNNKPKQTKNSTKTITFIKPVNILLMNSKKIRKR